MTHANASQASSSMTQNPPPTTEGTDDMARWREAWRIRRAHPKWAVLWVAPADEYRAHRLSRTRRDTILTATTPEDLTAQIEQAEQVTPGGLER
jgi:hypothetical protein